MMPGKAAGALLLLLVVFRAAGSLAQTASKQLLWTFDRLEKIGGLKTTVEGDPKIVDTPVGKAVEFDGVEDAIWIGQHPLAGAATFTFEATFRPDGGEFAQRWFHLAERDPVSGLLASSDHPTTGQDSNPRILFELRAVGDSWYLDAWTSGPGYSRALMFKDKLHPIRRWYHVAQTYDGTIFRSYVNGVLQGEAEIAFKPQGDGAASIGARINRRSYFKGAIRQARFTHRALTPDQFMTVREPPGRGNAELNCRSYGRLLARAAVLRFRWSWPARSRSANHRCTSGVGVFRSERDGNARGKCSSIERHRVSDRRLG